MHHETGEPIPAELVAKIKKAATFNQGFATTEYLASALMDMKYHTMDPAGLDVDAFERAALAELNMPGEIVMRHRSPHFGHIFSGEGYSAGYYSYMWADVLTARRGGGLRRGAGRLLRQGAGEEAGGEHLFAVRQRRGPGRGLPGLPRDAMPRSTR